MCLTHLPTYLHKCKYICVCVCGSHAMSCRTGAAMLHAKSVHILQTYISHIYTTKKISAYLYTISTLYPHIPNTHIHITNKTPAYL